VAASSQMIRACPICSRDSIIGHGRRRKQAHDETHDWIRIRRGICNLCGATFTLLPCFSLPYAHYTLVARSQALRRYFTENHSLENAAPSVKDPDRIADPSTLRRWFHSLDSSRPPFSRLRTALETISRWLAQGEVFPCGSLRLSWPAVFPWLQVCWPLRL
jgi:hypothetical protein